MTRAYVLHTRPWRDTSLLVEWFTEDFGRLTTYQRGARNRGKKSPLRPMAFQCLHMMLVGRGDMKTATQIEPVGRAHLLQGQSLAVGFYLNELLMRALHRQEPAPGLFDIYARHLAELAGPSVDFGTVVRGFERDLLAELGVGIDWQSTADTQEPIDPQAQYWLAPEEGILQHRGRGYPVAGNILKAIADNQALADAANRRQARNLLQSLLVPHVGSAPFNSRALWRTQPQSGQSEQILSTE
ncbi:MAG: DNA repair protein RecO [Halothiobacillus sp. 14-55-98]|jgi:DNA repair protein RecO (recombination protein O)|nr:MAG: DNA repair protein RecO [Halothiobacillus sp. 14-55-98]